MHMIGLHRQFQNRPTLLLTLQANQVFAAFANLIHQHLSPAFRTPDEVVDNQMNMVFIALVVQGTHVGSPVDIPQQYLQNGKRQDLWLKPTQALTSAWPTGTAALRAIL
jgi:hypothetical protein